MWLSVFCSSLTSYQFVAAIEPFIVLMLLSMVGRWWQEYDIIRYITFCLGSMGELHVYHGYDLLCGLNLFP